MIPAVLAIIAIVLESWSSIWHSVDLFLKSQQLTVGAIITGMVPFFVIWNKLSKEKEKRVRAALVERRQLQIAFNINEIMEALKVESKWSLQEIGSSHEVRPNLKNWFLFIPKVSTQKRRMIMSLLTNILKANLSKKLISALVSIGVVSLNNKFNLNLSENTVDLILGLSLAHISLQTIIDSIKAWATSKLSAENIQKTLSPIANMTFQEAIPYLETIRDDFNDFLIHARLDDGSDKFQLAMKAFADIELIFKAHKIPEPLAAIVEDKVAS